MIDRFEKNRIDSQLKKPAAEFFWMFFAHQMESMSNRGVLKKIESIDNEELDRLKTYDAD